VKRGCPGHKSCGPGYFFRAWGPALFKASLQLTLEHLPDNSHVIIDGSKSEDIDFDALVIIYDFAKVAHERNIEVELKHIPEIRAGASLH
jgi:hypothetical protein